MKQANARKVGWLMSAALAGVALSLSGVPSATGAKAAPAPAQLHADIEGVWSPIGGSNFDPDASTTPDNKGRSSSEWRDHPPYNAEYEARYTKQIADIRAGKEVVDGSANCLPQGLPRMMVIPYPIDIIVQPKRVVMLFEPLSQRRIVHTDGRQHKNADDLDPTFSGESIGHWEGDTLVVDTIGIRPETSFDVSVAPHSDALHFVERIRRVGATLEDQFTVYDPKAFTKPWQITRVYKSTPELELNEYICENNRTQ